MSINFIMGPFWDAPSKTLHKGNVWKPTTGVPFPSLAASRPEGRQH